MRFDPYNRGKLCMLASLLVSIPAFSIAQQSNDAGLVAPAQSFALPTEIERDFGADNGDATIIRLLPLYSFPLNADWRLINLNLITIADAPGGVAGRPGNPNATSGSRAFGLGDLLHASFFTPESQKNFVWGAGFALNLPTATNDVLGSGKWAAGPAVRLTYRTGPWNLGLIAGQRWSFAGSDSRADTNALLIRGTIRRKLPHDWYFVYAPIVTANWDARSSQRWLVPVGGGLGKVFTLFASNWAASGQLYYNLIRPDAAPDWAMRLQLIAAIPF
ncbi:MAG: hypothetical protein KJO13_02695 [Gammaproteobacteria bacterium]|nr:hypothetical protein [Gammaproteobacteria bacterium]